MVILKSHLRRLNEAKKVFVQEAERADIAKEVIETFNCDIKQESMWIYKISVSARTIKLFII